jgi:large subunit ribosomal protein L4
MTTVQITTPAGGAEGSVELPAHLFDVTANVPLMHQVVVAQLAAARQGTHKAKTRGEVSGGGKKPYRQKGTGRARQGSSRAPQFNGGGVVHGPVPHGYAQRTPKKMKAAALRGALSDRARGGNVHVLSSLAIDETPSTKTAIGALKAVSSAKNILVVLSAEDVIGWKSLRNVPEVHLITSGQLNTYDVLVSDDVVFTKAALDEFVAGSSKSGVVGALDDGALDEEALDEGAPRTTASGRHSAVDVAVDAETVAVDADSHDASETKDAAAPSVSISKEESK